MPSKDVKCRFCLEPIDKDTAALNKKLIDRKIPRDKYVCLKCMAATLECSVNDLLDKIEEFKDEGCILFG